MRVQLRHAVVALVLVAVLPACTRAQGSAALPERQSPIAVPAAPPSPTAESEQAAPSELIAPEDSEQLAMRATSTMTVTGPAGTSTSTLAQSAVTDSAVEHNAGETQSVVRLATADAAHADDVQFSIDGRAKPGTFPTKSGELTVVFYNAPLGVDLLSDAGECTVVFTRVDSGGTAGSVSCADVAVPDGKAKLTATFAATATNS